MFQIVLGRRLLPLLLLEQINIVLYVWPLVIGPFSTTLVPLSSSSSVDRQVLINVEASAISPDERQFGFIFTKIPFTRCSDEEKKDQGAWTRSHVLSVCLRPPQTCLAPAATVCVTLKTGVTMLCITYINDSLIYIDRENSCLESYNCSCISERNQFFAPAATVFESSKPEQN